MKTVKIKDEELPKCLVCHEKEDADVNAEFLAHIAVSFGKIEFYEWHLVCKKHRRSFLAFKLVKDK